MTRAQAGRDFLVGFFDAIAMMHRVQWMEMMVSLRRVALWAVRGLGVLSAVALLAVAWWWLTLKPLPLPGALTQPLDEDARTTHPIVLAHGMMGFDHMGPLTYWPGIVEALQAHGASVFVTRVAAFQSSEVRGEQLLAQVQEIVARTGAVKVNLIGHSQGGHAIRYVAARRPDLVASVTVVATPVTGSEFADWMDDQVRRDTWAASAILALGRGAGRFVNWASGATFVQDVPAALASLDSRGTADFNRQFPAGVPAQPCGQGAAEVQGVRYFSWGGVGTFHHALNLPDYVMSLTGLAFKREAGDGLVGRCASHLGEVIRDDYPLNHFQIVNQLPGLHASEVDPVTLFVAHAQRLRQLGL